MSAPHITNCWNCGLPYHADADQCPGCNGVNANRDLERAQHESECKAAGSNPQPKSKSALQMLCEVDDHLQELQHYGHSHMQRYAMSVVQDMLEALEEAREGLRWYQDAHPEDTDGSDDEAMARIDAAIAKATGSAS